MALAAEWAECIIEQCLQGGIEHFFLSPGSRSTSLALAVHKLAPWTMHFDERGTAFAALGFGRSGKKAAVVCTSGSAVANLMPAAVEAMQDGVPLLLLTADRPFELRDCMANQTIDQEGIFGSFVHHTLSLPAPNPEVPIKALISAVSHVLWQLNGPVHINCPLREPFLGRSSTLEHTGSHIEFHAPESIEVRAFLPHLERDSGFLVLGRMSPRDAGFARLLAQSLGWPVYADVLSQCRLNFERAVYPHGLLDKAPPDHVVHLGGPILSKEVSAWLSCSSSYVLVSDMDRRQDPNSSITCRIKAPLSPLLRWALNQLPTRAVSAVEECMQDAEIDAFCSQHFGEISASYMLAKRASNLFLGNSLSIRHVDNFGPRFGGAIRCYGNRGCSGIDGQIATAAGLARGLSEPVYLLMGDLGFFHDLNSLSLIRDLPVTLVLLNNDGGGIFSFLPIKDKTPAFNSLFHTPHGLSAKCAAELFSLPYSAPSTSHAFTQAIQSPGIVEVFTDVEETIWAHKALEEICRSTCTVS